MLLLYYLIYVLHGVIIFDSEYASAIIPVNVTHKNSYRLVKKLCKFRLGVRKYILPLVLSMFGKI